VSIRLIESQDLPLQRLLATTGRSERVPQNAGSSPHRQLRYGPMYSRRVRRDYEGWTQRKPQLSETF
jgi:hypothetical protein